MVISFLTLFPEIFDPYLNSSILLRAHKKDKVRFVMHNIREYATDRHKSVDDRPYGGGPGMILRADILDKALAYAKKDTSSVKKQKIILTEANGAPFTQPIAKEWSDLNHLIIMCGHYEGVDARIRSRVDSVISIGPYVLTGGELPALVIADAVTRLIPGVLSKHEATHQETFTGYLKEPPQYTRPNVYKGMKVPEILLSGNHQKIKEWKERKGNKNSK